MHAFYVRSALQAEKTRAGGNRWQRKVVIEQAWGQSALDGPLLEFKRIGGRLREEGDREGRKEVNCMGKRLLKGGVFAAGNCGGRRFKKKDYR